VMDEAGLDSLRTGVEFLVDLKYLKPSQSNLIDEVFDGSIQERSLRSV
jgi:hypothetical protein